MQSLFTKALSNAVSNHIKLSETRRETLGWLALLVMQHGTICLWRLAAYVTTEATTDSVRRRFYRFFQYVKLDGAMAARVVVDVLGMSGKPWVLVMDRTNWEFGKTTINILMISVMWNGVGVPLIWTLLPSAGNSNTRTRVCLLNRLRKAFPNLKIASLMGDREFIGERWMAYLKRNKIAFILRLRENQHVVREGYETWTIADIAKASGPWPKDDRQRLVSARRKTLAPDHPPCGWSSCVCRRGNFWRWLAPATRAARCQIIAAGGRSKPCSEISKPKASTWRTRTSPIATNYPRCWRCWPWP